MSQVIQSQIQIWRQKVADGTISKEEMKQAIEAIRKERVQASTTSAKSRAAKAPAPAIDGQALLDDLMG